MQTQLPKIPPQRKTPDTSLRSFCLGWAHQLPQGLRFALVGAAAAGVHLCVAAVLIGWVNMVPLLGNVGGFLVAFGVSYAGHSRWTFARHNARGLAAVWRFFAVACLSFVVNEALYFVCLHYLNWHWLPSLIIVLLVVAVGTFILSKIWAFAAK